MTSTNKNRNIGLTPAAQRTVARCRRISALMTEADSWAAQLVLALLQDESLASACLIRLGINRDWLISGALGPEVAQLAASEFDSATSEQFPDDAWALNPNPVDALNDPHGFTEILDRASSLARRSDNEGGVTSAHLLLAVAETSSFVKAGFATLSVTAEQINELLNPVPPAEWTTIAADEELRLDQVRTGTEISGARFHRAEHVENVLHVRKTTVISRTIPTDSRPGTDAGTLDLHSAAWRVIDANLNRAREGLRVVEDFARFVANDVQLSGELKSLRHDLVTAAQLLPRDSSEDLLVSQTPLIHRNTIGDVGTELSTPGERHRHSMADLVTANCRRVQEALRSLEEFGKLLSPDFAAGCKQLRYRAYTVEKGLGEIMAASSANPLIRPVGHLLPLKRGEGTRLAVQPAFDVNLPERRTRLLSACVCLLVTESQCRLSWKTVVKQSLLGGADVIQLREKTLNDRELLRRARWLRDACHDAKALFIVNDRPEIAVAAAADGVHLGQDEMSVADARRILLPDQLLGVSTHDPTQVQQAFAEGADLIGIGPVFPSKTKSFAEFPGLNFVQSVAATTARPWFAIGGIDLDNLAAVIFAGASRVAIASVVAGSDDPAGVIREFKRMLQSALPESM